MGYRQLQGHICFTVFLKNVMENIVQSCLQTSKWKQSPLKKHVAILTAASRKMFTLGVFIDYP